MSFQIAEEWREVLMLTDEEKFLIRLRAKMAFITHDESKVVSIAEWIGDSVSKEYYWRGFEDGAVHIISNLIKPKEEPENNEH